MLVKDISLLIEKIAPLGLQEPYDNAGLIIGRQDQQVTGILLCLDVTEAVLEEAIAKNCNLVISHHPVIFKGIKKINGSNYTERTIIKAIQHDIAVYTAHTNLDNVLRMGVNEKIAGKLGLSELKVLKPQADTLSKLVVYSPTDFSETIRNAMFESGAGEIGNYAECSFEVDGMGSFKPNTMANPWKGKAGQREVSSESRIEVIVPNNLINKVLDSVKKVHPYEEVAYDIIPLKNVNPGIGAGIYGLLEKGMETEEFLDFIKNRLNLSVIRHTRFNKTINKIAICGGAGSFLMPDVKSVKADAYISSDIKYHEFFDADNAYLLCDIGHYESEIYTLEIFHDVIQEKYPTFAVIFCEAITNPIQYFK